MTLIDVEAFSVIHTNTITILNSSFKTKSCNILNGNQNDSIAHERTKSMRRDVKLFWVKKEEKSTYLRGCETMSAP